MNRNSLAPSPASLMAFYLSRDRVLSLLDTSRLPPNVLLALQGQNVQMASAVLSHGVSAYLLDAIASGGIKTLQQLDLENAVKPGASFIYHGDFVGKGFGASNKKAQLTLTTKLDEPVPGKKLLLEFSKSGLVNNTAYSRMGGASQLFVFAYIAEVAADVIRAIPFVIGDLVSQGSLITLPLVPQLELQPNDIDQFRSMNRMWAPSMAEFARLADIPEREVKELICRLLGEHEVPADWGGEEADLFSAQLLIRGERMTGAFLLKGPARFHPMTPRDLGKNGDQLYRLFNIPAQVYVVQHCHAIGPAIRKTVEAYALQRCLVAPCRYVIMDGLATAQLLRAHGRWNPRATETGVE